MSHWPIRIKQRMKELGMTQQILARKMGLTRGAITHYLAERRIPPMAQFQKLAKILKTNPAWLQFGTRVEHHKHSDKMNAQANHRITDKKVSTQKTTQHIQHYPIRVLRWEQVANHYAKAVQSTEASPTCISNFYTDQPRWYALHVRNDAMSTSLAHGDSFDIGDWVIVDPDARVTHGSYIIALLPRTKEVTFKQHVIDGGVRYLKPLNPQYPMVVINDEVRICGIVVHVIRDCKF